jgi:hypothetical protein
LFGSPRKLNFGLPILLIWQQHILCLLGSALSHYELLSPSDQNSHACGKNCNEGFKGTTGCITETAWKVALQLCDEEAGTKDISFARSKSCIGASEHSLYNVRYHYWTGLSSAGCEGGRSNIGNAVSTILIPVHDENAVRQHAMPCLYTLCRTVTDQDGHTRQQSSAAKGRHRICSLVSSDPVPAFTTRFLGSYSLECPRACRRNVSWSAHHTQYRIA